MIAPALENLTDAKPLAWLRVVDCSRGTAGTRASGLLADLGADVIWVEPPGGDPYREELCVEYAVFNRGKRSVEVDLKSASGRDKLVRLVSAADVFIESWRPGVADRLGVGYEALSAANPALVYCSISGFGQSGPYRHLPGYESLVHALAGSMYDQEGFREGPIFEALPSASFGASYLAVIATLAAIHRRDHDGRGRRVETSLYDGVLSYMLLWGTNQRRGEHSTSGNRSVCRNIQCGDDRYVAVHTGAVGAFNRLMNELGLSDRINPSTTGLDLTVSASATESAILTQDLPEIFLSDDSDSWIKRLLDADVCAAHVNEPGLMFDDVQVRHNEMILEIEDPVLGRVQQTAAPLRFNGSRPTNEVAAPLAGQNTAEVFRRSAPSWLAEPVPTVGLEPPASDDGSLLGGLRILDMGAFYAGPYSSRLLADLGADVIKLEPPNGDPLRGFDVIFNSGQARKRAIAADLKTDEGREIGRRLLRWADAVSHNMRPGAAERVRCGFDNARAEQPSVIYAHAPGWGNSGPFHERQSFAPILSVYVGLGHEVAGEFNQPIWPSASEDPGNGMVGAIGMLVGLLRRNRGVTDAQFIENPQLNAAVAHACYMVRTSAGELLGARRLDPLQFGFSSLDRLYQTRDAWICLSVRQETEWNALVQAFAPELLLDGRFTDAAGRAEHDYELGDHLATVFLTMAASEIVATGATTGVPVVVPVGKNEPIMVDPSNSSIGRVARVADPLQGNVLAFDRLVRVSDAKFPPFRLAPELGADTETILHELGFGDDEIADLRGRNIIRG